MSLDRGRGYELFWKFLVEEMFDSEALVDCEVSYESLKRMRDKDRIQQQKKKIR